MIEILGILLGLAFAGAMTSSRAPERTRSVRPVVLDPPNPAALKSDPYPPHQSWYTP